MLYDYDDIFNMLRKIEINTFSNNIDKLPDALTCVIDLNLLCLVMTHLFLHPVPTDTGQF